VVAAADRQSSYHPEVFAQPASPAPAQYDPLPEDEQPAISSPMSNLGIAAELSAAASLRLSGAGLSCPFMPADVRDMECSCQTACRCSNDGAALRAACQSLSALVRLDMPSLPC
jgi:hypothetical protein